MQSENIDDWLLDDRATGSADDDSVENDARPWKLLVVDDEPDVHSMTRLALRELRYRGRPMEVWSAYSAAEGFEMLLAHPDTSMILLDVVMETDDAGLRLAQRIRSELNNHLVRIVLRTGQPGQAPEEQIILDYDINDYKSKTELTARKLFVAVVASLRTYESLLAIELSRQGLRRILEGTANLYQYSSLQEFASGILSQVSAILGVGAEGVMCAKRISRASAGVNDDDQQYDIVAGTGKYADMLQQGGLPDDHPFAPLIKKGFALQDNYYAHPYDVLHFLTHNGFRFVIVFTPPWPLEEYQKDLLGMFCNRMASAFDNLYLYQQLQASSEATVMALADLAEFRDKSTGTHLVRVQKLTNALVTQLDHEGKFQDELTETFKSMIGTAAILHDVGKVTTPDYVLLKPGRHTDEERVIMREHAEKGQEILKHAAGLSGGENYLRCGAEIAGGHHEHFNGAGYPKGLKGNEIPLAARIVAVVDVFDALVHRRLYKEPWTTDQAFEYMRKASGTQFDPDVLAAFFAVVEPDPAKWIEVGDFSVAE